MVKTYAIPSMKLFISISFMLFTFVGCGGGGQNSGSIQNEETSNTLTVKVTPHILKTAYLPKVSSEDDVIYSIEKSTTEGNLTLLDEKTGRYTYISSTDALEVQDSFTFNVMRDDTLLLTRDVTIQITPIDIKINEIVQNDFSSNLPIVIIDTGDKEIPDEPKIKGSMAIIEPKDNDRSHLKFKPVYSGYMEIEIRGFSSQRFPKKQYSVDTETWDEEDDDLSLLGMPEEHKWVLHAPYADKSLMRNYLAYQKTRDVNESKYYAVRSHYVELLTRIDDHYRYDGVYVLMEKIKREKNRIDIEKLKDDHVLEPEITGGYLLQQDRLKDDDEYITGAMGETYVIEDPKASKINTEQYNYIEDHLWKFETALQTDDYNNSTSDEYYKNWIEVDSFIVHLLSREFFRDYDSWRTSEYFYKERNDLLSMGPVWDFNLGMGNCIIGYSGRVDGWSYTGKGSGVGYWADRLMDDPDFQYKVIDRWKLLRNTVWSDSNLTQFVESTKNKLSEAAARNFQRWPVLGEMVFLERKACTKDGVPVYCDTFESAVDEHLKVWLLERAKWIDGQLQ